MIAILDYKAGNQTSVKRALDALGVACLITAERRAIEGSLGIIFPGVGAAGQAMRQLADSGLDQVLREQVEAGKPLLGICVGCQILLDYSAENDTAALGIVPGRCELFNAAWSDEEGQPIRVPHMGWNRLHRRRQTRLLHDVPEAAEFYFVHSYYPAPAEEFVLATATYGREFCAIHGRDGLWAVQFHAEKSGRPGLQLLRNFHAYCQERAHAV